MPENLNETVRRYFVARDLGDSQAVDRFVYLELLEVDVDAGVARFEYELADAASELWIATVEGFLARQSVRDAVKEAVLAELVTGGTFEIALSDRPQLTQLEVRFAEAGGVTVYRIETQGSDPRDFRYRTVDNPDERFDGEQLAWRLEAGELNGYDLAEQTANGEWEFDGDEIAFDTEGVAVAAHDAFTNEQVYIYAEPA